MPVVSGRALLVQRCSQLSEIVTPVHEVAVDVPPLGRHGRAALRFIVGQGVGVVLQEVLHALADSLIGHATAASLWKTR